MKKLHCCFVSGLTLHVAPVQAFREERDQRQASITRRELKLSELTGSTDSLAQQLASAQAEIERQRHEIQQLTEADRSALQQTALLQSILDARDAEIQVRMDVCGS